MAANRTALDICLILYLTVLILNHVVYALPTASITTCTFILTELAV
ncbi:hypothetical protein [Dulcicalothrix desertica]|nr:hypothetical protein [Dulcicalothrix desertica]